MPFRMVLLALLAIANALPVHAQQSERESLVILGMAPGGANRLAVYLKPGFSPSTVLSVPLGTSPEELAGAFAVLHRWHHRMAAAGHAPRRGVLLRMDVPASATRRSLNAEEQATYSMYLGSFAQAREVEIPGVGRGRAVEVLMPDWPAPSRRQ